MTTSNGIRTRPHPLYGRTMLDFYLEETLKDEAIRFSTLPDYTLTGRVDEEPSKTFKSWFNQLIP